MCRNFRYWSRSSQQCSKCKIRDSWTSLHVLRYFFRKIDRFWALTNARKSQVSPEITKHELRVLTAVKKDKNNFIDRRAGKRVF